MRTIILTDLDDTLFCSLRKATGPVGPAITDSKTGNHSHMSAPQERMFALMRATGEVIPVTARSSDAFSRVKLDFGTRRAVLANGAIVLDENGEPDPDWFAHTSRIGRDASSQMEGMMATITEEFGETARTWIVEELGAPIYLCVKMNASDPELVRTGILQAAALLDERFGLERFQQHVNDNNLAFTPEGISKRDACAHLLRRLGDRSDLFLIGAGDSLTDLPFMGMCDYMMTPSGSQIAERVLPRSLREGEAYA